MSNDSISARPFISLPLKGVLDSELAAESMDLAAVQKGEAGRARGCVETVWRAIVRVLGLTNLTAAETAVEGMAGAPTDQEKLEHYLALMDVTAKADHTRFTYERQGESVVLRVTGTPLELSLGASKLGNWESWESRLTKVADYDAAGAHLSQVGNVNASDSRDHPDEIPSARLPLPADRYDESPDGAAEKKHSAHVRRTSRAQVLDFKPSVREKQVVASSPTEAGVALPDERGTDPSAPNASGPENGEVASSPTDAGVALPGKPETDPSAPNASGPENAGVASSPTDAGVALPGKPETDPSAPNASGPENGEVASSPTHSGVALTDVRQSGPLSPVASKTIRPADTNVRATSVEEQVKSWFTLDRFGQLWQAVAPLLDDPNDSEKIDTAKLHFGLAISSKFGLESQIEGFLALRELAKKSAHEFEMVGPNGAKTHLRMGTVHTPLGRQNARRPNAGGRDRVGLSNPRTISPGNESLVQKNEAPIKSQTTAPMESRNVLGVRPSHNAAPSGVQRPTTQARPPTWADIERFFKSNQTPAKAHFAAVLNPHLSHQSRMTSFTELKTLAGQAAAGDFEAIKVGERTTLKLGKHFVSVEPDGRVVSPKPTGPKS
ncbi:hypothetical protein [Pandoraea oxalativorans]|uniref:Uncharacterized protein n=1 Tax=Pandoraea oxalativorans TaxID=573737 RepID=A0A192B0V7_9BURK|nr:hypothetical protein [Pandoraea oxalativorans]ANJ86795.1 hypothetical protein MB84_31525 [Pandoraea oxalativorans]